MSLRDHLRGAFGIFAFGVAFTLVGCLVSPPKERPDGGDASDGGTVERDASIDSATANDSSSNPPPGPDSTIGAGPTCGPSTCPQGCCDSNGTCAIGTAPTACGSRGALCNTCAAGQGCDNQACSCGGAAACAGCCSAAATCVTSTTTSCGSAGGACIACAAGQECTSGRCVCDATSCPNGCCDGTTCVPNGSQPANKCGSGGAACATCATGQACSALGTCTCTPASCSNGCCSGATCLPTASQSTSACGSAGNACGTCATGQTCSAGACSCGGASCNGCCSGGATCEAFANQSPGSCGTGGGACAPCSLASVATASCTNGACGIASCSSGSGDCDGVASNGCETNTNTSTTYCGACGAGHTCTGGTCTGGVCSCPGGQILCNGVCVNSQTSGANCGRCGHSCAYGSCSSGKCTQWTVASSSITGTPAGVVSDGTNVIWADVGLKEVLEVPAAGSTSAGVLAGDPSFGSIPAAQNSPISIGSGTVVWITSTSAWKATAGVTGSGTLLPFTFPAGIELLNVALNTAGTRFIVMDYTAAQMPVFDCPLGSTSCAMDGNTPFSSGMAAGATRDYFPDPSDNVISEIDFGGPAIHFFVTGLSLSTNSTGVAVDSNNVYWVNGTQIVKDSQLTTGNPIPLANLPSGLSGVVMATDGTNVYLTTTVSNSNGQVVYVPIAGCCSGGTCCTATDLVPAGGDPSSIAVAGGMVFWIDGANIYGVATP